MTDLTGRTALLTGSARGVGRAIALRHPTLGANVVINYASDEAAANQTVRTIEDAGGHAYAIQADVTKVAEIFARDIRGQGARSPGVSEADREPADAQAVLRYGP